MGQRAIAWRLASNPNDERVVVALGTIEVGDEPATVRVGLGIRERLLEAGQPSPKVRFLGAHTGDGWIGHPGARFGEQIGERPSSRALGGFEGAGGPGVAWRARFVEQGRDQAVVRSEPLGDEIGAESRFWQGAAKT